MKTNFTRRLIHSGLAASALLLASGAAFAQAVINLTAGPATATLPDGSSVPMWGYSCGAVVSASTGTCRALNPAATTAAVWSPVVITVPTGQNLTVNLTNGLSFAAGAGTNTVPTSLVIVGQLGAGLGTTATSTLSPSHANAQANVTWPIAGPAGNPGTPPTQGARVQSFATEVAAGATTSLTWTAPRPGTYLIESGTHPSIQAPMGLYGILVVTAAPTAAAGVELAAGTAYPGVAYDAEVPLVFSEIDPVQNGAVQAAVGTAGFSETMVWSGQPGGCGNPSSATYRQCYPPAVNYVPLYYLINGVAFSRNSAASSLFTVAPATTAAATGSVLVRMVNAGLHMHVPAIVGSQTGTTAAPAVPPTGFALIAEDGNPLPGLPRVQSEVFMAAGKTYDVMVNVPAAGGSALPVYDRELSLSGNAIARDAGMLAYISVNGAGLPATPAILAAGAATANADSYSVVPGNTLTVVDPAKGLIANDIGVYGVRVLSAPASGTALTLNADGTFAYGPTATTWTGPDTFTYCANTPASVTTCPTNLTAKVTITQCSGTCLGTAPVAAAVTFTSNITARYASAPPGVLGGVTNTSGLALTAKAAGTLNTAITLNADGSFIATGPGSTAACAAVSPAPPAGSTCQTFSYQALTSTGLASNVATAAVIFAPASGLLVNVLDGKDKTPISDYRWIIEEDRTFYVDPGCTTNPPPASCKTGGIVPTFGANFHTSFMPVIATGCTGALSCEGGQTVYDPTSGAHINAVCDIGNGVCRAGTQETIVLPGAVHLDPTKRYYLSVLPGDAANPFIATNLTANCTNGASQTGAANCGHGMGGAPLAAGQTSVTVLTQPAPYPPAKLSIFVFEDDFPLNGEQDGGGGIDVLSPLEPGLGGFFVRIMDDAGGPGDATGQVDYDMFNQPLANSLAGTKDPVSGLDACPVGANSRIGANDPTQTGITGVIVTCPKYESDGKTLSPLAGQAVVANMMPGRYGIWAMPGADRIARGEEWLQTNTLDGQKAHDSFLRIGEPSFFQEYGPAGYHVSIGFANPAIINSRLAGVCAGTDIYLQLPAGTPCGNTLSGLVTTERMSRTPDERLYSSGSRQSFTFTQCYVSVGDPDGEDFAFTKCNADGTFTLSGLPDGDWRITTFDQWNDQLVDGLSTPIRLGGTPCGTTNAPGCNPATNPHNVSVEIAANQWQANFMTRTFLDVNKDGVSQGTEPGLALVKTNVRFRDGSFSNRNNTDLNGYAAFNEEFPLFSWYVIETDVTRFKNTGTHVVYDAGGPADGSPSCTDTTTAHAPCGSSAIGAFLANTAEQISLPNSLRIPGAVYCAGADCAGSSIATGPVVGGSSGPPCTYSANSTAGTGGTVNCTLSTGRIDPPWVLTEAWQGFSGQNNFLEFGKTPYVPGETGGIRGHVVYSSTRPFDDPQFNTQNVWEPLVPGVTMNLYQEGTAPDGSVTRVLVDTTTTTSWDNWAQGFRSDGMPNMNCPGQFPGASSGYTGPTDLFFFTLFNQPMYLDAYNAAHNGAAPHTVPYGSQFKCYDGMHNWNQLQPAPYDGMYQFPSVTAMDPVTGKPTGTNCTICTKNPDAGDPYRSGTPMLPAGKYVVEVVVPPGYELVKEEDKNILIGDNFIAPVTLEFPGLGSAVYIVPDQAAVGSLYNSTNAQNPTQHLGRIEPLTSHEGDTPTVDTFWPCVGALRTVPDYISLFPNSHEVAPFAGATKHLCDAKEVTLDDQTSAQAEFFVFTSAHAAAHFTGVITDDFTSEFDPFSPQFGEKFSPANLPVSIKDWAGNEISRVYADQWGSYNGLTYSTWEVNPPNPTGYSPTMMITCMNDAGPIPDPAHPGQTMADPLYNPGYSQFCYEIPFMPGATQYMDTPVTPTSAFASAGYNNPDCAYPDTTPAIKEVDGDALGPWVAASGSGHTLKITALGDTTVNNYGYVGPQATTAPFNQKTVTRHYGFGSVAGTVALVGADGVPHPLTGVAWTDLSITGTVPGGVPNCPVQQQSQYKGTTAQCGELVITAANGKQSIDTVTVTIGGKQPKHIAPTDSIQAAIDAAAPGDMLMIDPTCTSAAGTVEACTATGAIHSTAAHNEMLLMWKPVRLQGVGAASSIINANTHPAGKLDGWRRQVNCLFGLAINGTPVDNSLNSSGQPNNPFDPTGAYACGSTNGVAWQYFKPFDGKNPQIDRLPLEATVGWDANLNGNLAELLQEPSLMGALEGAAITVLAKGVNFPSNPFDSTLLAGFPTGTTLLTAGSCGRSSGTNPFPSNFQCNPSSVDGLTITNSSQGGGGIFVHGWGHNIQIANNRVQNNSGTLSGGINIGQGEYPPGYLQGSATNAPPGSCQNSNIANVQLPYCHDLNVNVHHNSITLNSSTGDELFSATPAGAGGVSFCTGSDYYKFNYNWVCGNLSTGDGGGVGHLGFSYNGDIEHNWILFNQSTNPTIATNGGGILVYGAPDVDPPCGANTDVDCLSPANTISPSDGAGPGLVINANLIMGNAAESGSGGGLRLHNVNGSEVLNFPTTPSLWYQVTVTNNIIANNVAGWDGAGISLQDALNVNIINNTVISNDTTASSGTLFNTLGAPLASSQGPCAGAVDSTGTCTVPWTTSSAQPAGLVAVQNSAVLTANLPATVTCPPGHYAGTGASNGTCRAVSYPALYNNVFWQNRSFYIGVGQPGVGTLDQQNIVTLFEGFTTTAAPSQPTTDASTANGGGALITGGTGACTPSTGAPNFWDIGVRGDTGPANHGSGVTLAPVNSVLTDAADYPGASNLGSNPTVVSQYCNGSRVPPEYQSMGYQVPPGISDATVPNPVFSLTPAATVDEGNNWINIAWGPLSLTNPTVLGVDGNYGGGAALGNYALAAGSPAINQGLPSVAPATDFFGNARDCRPDIGAVEFVGPPSACGSVTGGPLAFGNVLVNTTSGSRQLTLHNTGNAALTGITLTFSAGFARAANPGSCGGTLAAGANCTINVVFQPTALLAYNGTLTIAANVPVVGSPVTLTGTGVAPVVSASLTPIAHDFGTVTRGSAVGTFQAFRLTNTGNVPLTGITQGVIGGANSADFPVFRLLSTCGPAGGGQLLGQTTLAPGANCVVTIQFRPGAADAAGAKAATLTVTDLAGAQVSSLTGTAR